MRSQWAGQDTLLTEVDWIISDCPPRIPKVSKLPCLEKTGMWRSSFSRPWKHLDGRKGNDVPVKFAHDELLENLTGCDMH